MSEEGNDAASQQARLTKEKEEELFPLYMFSLSFSPEKKIFYRLAAKVILLTQVFLLSLTWHGLGVCVTFTLLRLCITPRTYSTCRLLIFTFIEVAATLVQKKLVVENIRVCVL